MKTKKWPIASLWLLAIMLFLAGCTGQETKDPNATANDNHNAQVEQQNEEAAQSEDQQPAAPEATVYPLTVTDASGEEITFNEAPQKIVSTSPAETEILFMLGLDEQILAVSDYCNYPEAALTKEKVGSIVTPNAEAIIALEADLVVSGISMDDAVAASLRGMDILLYKTNPKTIDDVLANILQIGVITDRQQEAQELVASMEADRERVLQSLSGLSDADKHKVYVEFAPGYTVGKGEFMHELIELSGGINIAGELEGWQQIDEEKIIADNPDVIVFAAGLTDYNTGKDLVDVIKERSGWDQISAIANDRLHGLDQDILARPGPRITQGLILMANAIYPELVEL